MRSSLLQLLRFLAAGIPAFLIAIPLNYFLIENLHWSKSAAYAAVLLVQVTINFFACIFFVFKRNAFRSLASQFAIFAIGILATRALDWALYSFLVSVIPVHYVLIQLINVVVFSIAKFTFVRRTIEGAVGRQNETVTRKSDDALY